MFYVCLINCAALIFVRSCSFPRGYGTILLNRNPSQIFHPQGEARRMLRDQDHLIILNHHGSVQLRVVIHVHLWLKTFLHLEKLERIIWFSFFKGTAKNWSDYWSCIQLANTLKQAKITTNGRKMLLCLGKRNAEECISKDNYLKLKQKVEEKPGVVRSMGFENRVRLDGGLSWEVNLDPGTVWSLDAYLLSKLEWGKGLAQKREAELGWRS
ncbi:hypothetical protein NC652_001589 [Populus alba x Populus x berolinensis]|nr:hypothetical protein NC652_001589 [Populus alba x Populus x berolinensis]